MSDPDSARECARRNVKRVLIIWSQFYVVLVKFRTYLYALRCVQSIYSYTAYAFERALFFIPRLCSRDVIDTAVYNIARTESLMASKDFAFNKKFLSRHNKGKKTSNKKILHVLQNNEKPIMFLQEN